MKKTIVLALVVTVSLLGAWYSGSLAGMYADYPDRQPLPTIAPNTQPFIIAHRGDTNIAPENTMAAFRVAINNGAEYIEVDIRLTLDGVPVVIHDGSLDRTTNGTGSIKWHTYAEVQNLDAGSWFSPKFTTERVPTLEEVLNEARGKICILAHLKAVHNYATVKLLKEFAENTRDYCLLIGPQAHYDNSAFPLEKLTDARRKQLEQTARNKSEMHYSQLRIFDRYWPEAPYTASLKPDATIESVLDEYPGVVAISVIPRAITRDQIETAHDYGLLVYARVDKTDNFTWSELDYINMLDIGLDGFFIGDVEVLNQVLETYR
jgi:glycerophosphoryl diester phosphodiesterase